MKITCSKPHTETEWKWYHCRMTPTQKRIFAILIFISAVYFTVFIFPNNTGAKDQMMISLFEPDEFAQYPVVLKMLTPGETFKQTVYNFITYGHLWFLFHWTKFKFANLVKRIIRFTSHLITSCRLPYTAQRHDAPPIFLICKSRVADGTHVLPVIVSPCKSITV